MDIAPETIIEELIKSSIEHTIDQTKLNIYRDAIVETSVSLSTENFRNTLSQVDDAFDDLFGSLSSDNQERFLKRTYVYMDTGSWTVYFNGAIAPKQFQKYIATHEAAEHLQRVVDNKLGLPMNLFDHEKDEHHIQGLLAEYRSAKSDGVIDAYQEWWRQEHQRLLDLNQDAPYAGIAKERYLKQLASRESIYEQIKKEG
jgi:hypothetical protein